MILAITTFFKPLAGNDIIASATFARSSIAGTPSRVREVVDFRSHSLRHDYGDAKDGASVVTMGWKLYFHLHKAPAKERQVQLKSIGVIKW
jgi:hypothetical protein